MTIADSLRLRLSLLFLAFLALVTASVAVTFVTLERQRHDARLINLAATLSFLNLCANRLQELLAAGAASSIAPVELL